MWFDSALNLFLALSFVRSQHVCVCNQTWKTEGQGGTLWHNVIIMNCPPPCCLMDESQRRSKTSKQANNSCLSNTKVIPPNEQLKSTLARFAVTHRLTDFSLSWIFGFH